MRDPASPNTPLHGKRPKVQILRGTCAIHAAIRPRAHHAGNRSSTPRGSCNLCKHRCVTGQGSGTPAMHRITLHHIASHHITSPLPSIAAGYSPWPLVASRCSSCCHMCTTPACSSGAGTASTGDPNPNPNPNPNGSVHTHTHGDTIYATQSLTKH